MSKTLLFAFLGQLDADLQVGLRAQLRILWTHHTTALEGNTLTLGDTQFVLSEGLTVAGKPLKDHQEVVGFARAIDSLADWLTQTTPLSEQHLFTLHRAVQTEQVTDIMAPVGAWKVEPNGTQVMYQGALTYNDTYAWPADVPALMAAWLALLEQTRQDAPAHPTPEAVLASYVLLHASFARIHPFADGNGRMARLLANIPVLEAGLPPIVIPHQQREAYLRSLAEWQIGLGRISKTSDLREGEAELGEFRSLCQSAWRESLVLVEHYKALQDQRAVG